MAWASDSDFKRLHALTEAYCHSCHKADKDKGGLDLARFTSLGGMQKELAIWQDVADLIADRSMPPSKEPKQPSANERTQMLTLLKKLLQVEVEAPTKQAAHVHQPAFGANARLAKEGKAFLDKHCISCHGPDKQKGSVRLDGLSGNLLPVGKGDDMQLWQSSLLQIETGQMPPPSRAQPSVRQRFAMTSLIHKALADAGNDLSAERMEANKANYLQHELLFGPEALTEHEPALQPRVWRINPQAWLTAMVRSKVVSGRRDGNRAGGIEPPISLAQEPGIRDFAYRYTISAAEAGQVLLTAETILTALMKRPAKGKRANPFAFIMSSGKEPSSKQLQAAVQLVFEMLLQRPPTAEEASRFGAFLAKACSALGTKQGLVVGLKPIFLHPEALFKIEAPKLRPGNHQVLRNLTFALCDAPPPNSWPKQISGLIKKHGDKPIPRRDLKTIAQYILRQGLAKNEGNNKLRFIQEFFDYTKAKDVFKDDETLKKAKVSPKDYDPKRIIQASDTFAMWVLRADKDVLRKLLVNINYPAYRRAIGVAKKKTKRITTEQMEKIAAQFKPSARGGLLAQQAWLIAHSTNTENDIVHRGKWIRERLLAGQIPDVPITVDANVPEEPGHTLRHRMRVTKDPYCWKCHRRMDPLGFPFEMFDHLGRHRTHELGKPVVATGFISETGEADVDGDVNDALELIERLARSERVEQSFVRHAFRFYLGRNEGIGDAKTLQEAQQAYRKSGGSLNALIAYLVTSDSFLHTIAQQTETVE